jgi:8-oxo-dGTP diphosphatase
MTTDDSRKGSKNTEISEEEFLSGYDPSGLDRPSVAVDVVLLTACEGSLFTTLVRRETHPCKGCWSLPGGFIRLDEPLEDAATRVLHDKVGIDGVFLEQLYTFGDPGRDPRTRVLSVAHMALIDRRAFEAAQPPREGAAVGRVRVEWAGETGGPVQVVDDDGQPYELAFDHEDILGMAVKRIRGKLDYTPIGFQLLGDRFTLLDLQKVHETVLGHPVNKDSFRRRMLASGQLEATGERQRQVGHRPAALYRFARRSAI